MSFAKGAFVDPSFDPDHYFGVLLKCPVCSEDYLHHGRVMAFDRDGEDAETGTVRLLTSMRSAQVADEAPMTVNPSPRRGSVVIEFYCENCGDDVVHRLSVVQHKGCSYLGWMA